MMDADTSRADDVAAAFKELSSEGGGEDASSTAEPVSAPNDASTDATPALQEAVDKTSSTRSDRTRDEAGRFAKGARADKTSTTKPDAPPLATTTATEAPKAAPPNTTSTATPPGTETTATEALKPPQSWTVTAKEQWKKLPRELQQEVVKREKESYQAIRQYQDKARVADNFHQVVSPYVGFIQAEGGDVFRAVGNLLQTAVALRTAPPAAKGRLMAQMMDEFGIDPDHVNAAWAGQPAQDNTSSTFDPRSFAQQVRQEVMRDLQQERQRAYQVKAAQELESFQAKNEFYDDVKEDMADMLEVAARRKLKLSLEDAYARACALHPEVSRVVDQRREAERANANQASTQQSVRASSSVRSEPSAVVATPEAQSLRGDIQAVISELRGRR